MCNITILFSIFPVYIFLRPLSALSFRIIIATSSCNEVINNTQIRAYQFSEYIFAHIRLQYCVAKTRKRYSKTYITSFYCMRATRAFRENESDLFCIYSGKCRCGQRISFFHFQFQYYKYEEKSIILKNSSKIPVVRLS